MTSYRPLYRIFIAGMFAIAAIRTFAAPNAAPVNSVPGAQATDEDTALVFSAGDGNQIHISDADAGSGSVGIALAVTHGTLTLSGTSGLSFILGSGTGDASMLFTGTLGNINAALSTLTYQPSADFNGTATLTLTTNDQGNTGTGGAQSDTDSVSITVNAINDGPVAYDDLATTAPGTPIDVDVKSNDRDIDNVAADLTVSILNNSLGTSASVNPDGTVNFDPGATSGLQTVTYYLTDPDGEVSNTATLTINVAADSLPAGSDASATMDQDDGYDFQLSDFSFNDADGGDTLFAVRIATLPAKGVLTLSGYAVNAGQSIATADLVNLRFDPAASESGTPYTSFTFSVQDSRGGYDATPNTFVLNVTPPDTTPPTTTIASVAFSADTGTSATDFITKTAAQTISGTLSANLAADETVQVSLDNGATWTAATASVGISTWSLAGQTLTGSNTLKVRVADAANNYGTALSQAYVLDTSTPTVLSIVRTTPSTQIMRASSVVFTVTFSEAVSNIGTGSFLIVPLNGSTTTATLASVTGGPVVYQVTVNITGGAGDFRLDVGPLISTFATGLGQPNAMVFDGAGNLYVADDSANTIRKVTSGGVVSTLASISAPYGITISAAGDLYVSSFSEVKKITTGGVVSTFASGFNAARGLAFDSAGNLYVGNYGDNTVSKVTTGGAVSTYLTGINAPFGMTIGASDTLYIASRDTGAITKVTSGGVTSTFAGGFNGPHEVELDGSGNLYVADRWGNRVAKVAPDGTVSTYANGVNAAYGLAIDAAGDLYVSSYLVDNKVSKITLPVINDQAGNAVTGLPFNTGETYTYDPNDAPTDIALSSVSASQPAGSGTTIGTLSTTDADSGDSHTYTLVSGSGSTDNASFAIAGNSLNVGASPLVAGSYAVRIQTDDGQGGTFAKAFVITVVDNVVPQITSITRKTPTTQANPSSTAVFEVTFSEAVTGVDTSRFTVTPVNGSTVTGTFVSITGGPTVYEVTVSVTGGAGDFRLDMLAPSAPSDFGPSLTAPWGLAFDSGGNLYVANNSSNSVSKVASDGTTTTFGSTISSPRGLAFDSSGNLYVANSGNSRVNKVASDGTTTNFVTGTNGARGLAFDGAGNLFVSNFSSNTVSKVTSGGVRTTFATGFSGPAGLAFDTAGNLYVANSTANTVMCVKSDGTKTTFATGFNNPEGLKFDAAGNLYVTNYTGGTLVKIAAKGLTSTVATGLSSPTGLVFDSAGRLYVSVNGSSKVIRFDVPTIDDLAGNSLSGLPYSSGDTYTYTPNSVPTDIALSNASVNKSGGTNATVGTLTTTDADSGDTHTYTLVTGTGSTNNASFNVSGSTLRANNASTLPAGNYSVRIQTDDGNGGTFQKAFSLTVVDDIPPVVNSVNVPRSDSYGIGQAMNFVVNFSKVITVGTPTGTPRLALTLDTGGTVYATYVSGSGTSGLTFRYTVVAGNLDANGIAVGALNLNGGTLKDAANNDATLTLNSVGSTTGVRVDGESPQIVSVARKTPSAQIVRAGTAVFEVTFAKDVFNVGAGAFVVTPVNGSTVSAAVASVSGGPRVYAVTVNINGGAGDFRLDLISPTPASDYAVGIVYGLSMAFDSAGDLFVTNDGVNRVSKVTTNGTVSIFATGFSGPEALAFDSAGTLYVAGTGNNQISKVSSSGVLTPFASGFTAPVGLAFDSADNLYVSNIGDGAIKQVTPAGVVSTFATGFNTPWGSAFDGSGNLFVADLGNGTVRKVTPGGVVTTFATGFGNPMGLTFDHDGNLYVANSANGTVSKVTSDGTAITLFHGLTAPSGLAFDSAGSLYVLDYDISGRIVKLSPALVIDSAGNSLAGVPYTSGAMYTYDPNDAPTDLTLSHSSVNLSDGTNATVGALTTTDADSGDTHTYSLVSGTGSTDNTSFNLSGSTLRANNASALAPGNYSIRIQTDDGNGGTFAKVFTIVAVDNIAPVVTSVSVPANASYGTRQPMDFVVHFTKNVTVDITGGTPRLALTLNTGGTVYATYVSGSGTGALTFRYMIAAGTLDADGIVVGALSLNGGTLRDGAGNNATLTLSGVGSTAGVLVDAQAPQIISIARKTPLAQITRTNTVVFEVTFSKSVAGLVANAFAVTSLNGGTAAGTVTSVTGGPSVYQVTVQINSGAGDFRLDLIGSGVTPLPFAAGFTSPVGIAFDSANNLYVTSLYGDTVTKVDTNGNVSVFASGLGQTGGLAFDSAGNLYVANLNGTVNKVTTSGIVSQFAAGFHFPVGLAFDGAGNLYVANFDTNTVSKVTSSGTVSLFASGFNGPSALKFDAAGNLYVANNTSNTVSKVNSGGVVTLFASGFDAPIDLAFDSAGNLYVANTNSNTVSKVTSNGTVSNYAAVPNGPEALAFDSGGTLYVAEINTNRVSALIASSSINDAANNALGGLPYTAGEIYTYTTNDAPTDITLSHTSVNLSAGVNAVVGTLSTTDTDSSDTHTYSLASGAGGINNGSFNISGASLRANNTSALAPGNYSVRIETNDANGGVYDKAFTVVVIDDVAPVVTNANITLSGASGPGGAFQVGDTVTAIWNNTAGGDNNADVQTITFNFTPFGGGATVAATNSAGTWTATYTIVTGFTSASSYSVSMTATDGGGNVATGSVTHGVVALPVFTVQPLSQSFPVGYGVTFLAAASNATTPTYQWQKNGVNISGATSASYGIGSVTANDAGSYRVIATNPAGSTTSNAAVLSVILPVVESKRGTDFDGDGRPDFIWQNTTTGERSFWLMDGTQLRKGVSLGIFAPDWFIAGMGDFDRDGQGDLIWQNTITGECSLWLMNGTALKTGVSLGTYSPALMIAGTGDFNGDGFTDIVWQNVATGQRTVMFMNGTTPGAQVGVGTLSAQWAISGVGDFNADGKPDLVWPNGVTGEVVITLMNGTTVSSTVSLGVLTKQDQVVATGDYNGDGKTDLVWTNISTGVREIWLMNGTTHVSTVTLGVISPDWSLGRPIFVVSRTARSDFDADGQTDFIWQNTLTGDKKITLMNGTTLSSTVSLGTFSTNWVISATGDFNHDEKPDLVWTNTATGERSIWLMDGLTHVSTISLAVIPTYWVISAAGDFNHDGKPDLVWTNILTGERSLWLMNDAVFGNGIGLGTIPTEWTIAVAVDLNGDGNTDLVWQNKNTGECSVWLMNGGYFSAGVGLGTLSTQWHFVGGGDFNHDGHTDLLLQNTATGERAIWLMNGTTHFSTVSLGSFSTDWSINN